MSRGRSLKKIVDMFFGDLLAETPNVLQDGEVSFVKSLLNK